MSLCVYVCRCVSGTVKTEARLTCPLTTTGHWWFTRTGSGGRRETFSPTKSCSLLFSSLFFSFKSAPRFRFFIWTTRTHTLQFFFFFLSLSTLIFTLDYSHWHATLVCVRFNWKLLERKRRKKNTRLDNTSLTRHSYTFTFFVHINNILLLLLLLVSSRVRCTTTTM